MKSWVTRAATRTRTGGDATRSAPRRTSADIGEQAWHDPRHAQYETDVTRRHRGRRPRQRACSRRPTSPPPQPARRSCVRDERQPALRAGRDAGQGLELVDGGDAVVGTGTVDTAGSLAWRDLDAGSYTVRTTSGPVDQSATATVTDFDDPAPAQSFYAGQTLDQGLRLHRDPRRHHAVGQRRPPPGHRPVPDRRRVLRLRPEQPRQHDVRPALQRPGLRLRRREHPRHRLLGRLRSAPSSRSRASTATT